MITITKYVKAAVLTGAMSLFGLTSVSAQEEADSSGVSLDGGLDIYSSYVFRGTKFGTGPAFQPWVELTAGNFALGAWGSANAGSAEAAEMDLYLSYSFDFGLSLGLTDYYYPGTQFFDFKNEDEDETFGGSHAIEINLGYEIGDLSLSANYIPMEAQGAENQGSDLYVEAAYAFGNSSVFLGAGNGWYTIDEFPSQLNDDGEYDDVFGVVNIGVSTEKEIQITDKFALPLTGSVILNPQSEQFYITAGISF